MKGLIGSFVLLFILSEPPLAHFRRTNRPAPLRLGPTWWGTPTGQPPAPDDGSAKHVPGSTKSMTISQVRDGFNVPDWNPDQHAQMPEVVEHGRKPDVRACGWCHMPDGVGRPENAGLSGLPATYIVQQIADFRSDARKSSQPKFGPLMAVIAKAASDSDVQAAADYFSAQKPRVWIRVVETATVPKTTVAGMLVPVEGGPTEPIGKRIVEVPENPGLTELRDGGSGFVAYVPPGSIEKGNALGDHWQRRQNDAVCHVPRLRPERPRPRPRNCRTFAKLPFSSALRYSAWYAQRTRDRTDEGGRGSSHTRGHDRHRRLHILAPAITAACRGPRGFLLAAPFTHRSVPLVPRKALVGALPQTRGCRMLRLSEACG